MIFTGALMVPFINFLYKLKFQNPKYESKDFLGRESIFNDLHGWKMGTPTGGGILVIISSLLFSVLFYAVTEFNLNWTSIILFTTLILFGLLGLYDDVSKFFKLNGGFWGLRFRHKFTVQWILGIAIGCLLYAFMDLHTVFVPVLGPLFDIAPLDLGGWYIAFAAFMIVATSNAFNITDGMDGLSSGLLLIALSTFWVIVEATGQGDVALFIAVLVGSLIPFLYFNIYPARVFMGDTGALAFGAMLGVVALMVNQSIALLIIGGVFFAEGLSSMVQIFSMKFRDGKKIFLIAPLHHHLEAIGWDETKVTMRMWLLGTVLAFVGLFIATM